MSFTASTRRRLLVAGGGCFAVLAVLSVMGHSARGTLDDWDSVLTIGPEHWYAAHPSWRHPLNAISRTFTTLPMATYALVVVGLLALRRQWRAALFVFLAMGLTLALTPGLKAAVDRPRPAAGLVTAHGSALPSGHAAYIAAAVGVLVVAEGVLTG